MTKQQEKLVKQVVGLQESLDTLSVDKINESPESETPPEIKLSNREKAAMENAKYIEPKAKMPAFGKLPDKLKAERDRDWEYVKGIYENYIVNGEPLSFWFSKYPGDQDCLWEIPANIPVFVPRMIAKHLEEVQKYHTFEYIEKPNLQWKKDDFTHMFAPSATHYRGKFRPIGAFS